MKLALIQTDIVWCDPEANRRRMEERMRLAEQCDLYVLPEMFTTGFAIHPEGVAERNGATQEWMLRMARTLDGAVCGSVAVEEDGRFYNRLHFVCPDGKVATYDKRHLFAYGGENLSYTRGETRVEVEFRGVRFLLQVCYDLRFPTFSRNHPDTPYDCAIYVASWPQSRQPVWDTLLRARAIENQCYVIGVNRVGSDPSCTYGGGSQLIDPYGHIAASIPPSAEETIIASLDTERLQAFRRKFPVLDDAD